MSNILTFKEEIDERDYLFMVSDSQLTKESKRGGHSKGPRVQKLATRGPHLVAWAGDSNFGKEVVHQLLDKDCVIPPYDLAQTVYELSKKELSKIVSKPGSKVGEKCLTVIVVAGRGEESMKMYEVQNMDTQLRKKGVYEVSYSNVGGGEERVSNAIERDQQIGMFQGISDITEALFLCYSMGKVAYGNLSVDDQLQYGFVTHHATRILLPKNISPISPKDWLKYLSDLAGFEIKESKKIGDENFKTEERMARAAGALYNALETELYRMYEDDITMNSIHQLLKQGKTTLEDYEVAFGRRESQKSLVQQILTSLLDGGMDNIILSSMQFYRRELGNLKETGGMYRKNRRPNDRN